MSWFEIPEVNCLFALDYNSEISENGKYIHLSNNNTKRLYSQGYLKGLVSKEEIKAFESLDFFLDHLNYNIYKTLSFYKQNFIFEEPIKYPTDSTNEFTFVLKQRLRSSTKFLSETELVQGKYGLSFTSTSSSDSYDDMWRFIDFEAITPGIKETFPPRVQRRPNYGLVFDTVILRVNLNIGKGDLITTYGTFELPSSIINSPSALWTAPSFNMIGAPDPAWKTDSDIVAYGFFDKALSDLQLESMLADINSELRLKNLNSKTRSGFLLKPVILDYNRHAKITNFLNKIKIQNSIIVKKIFTDLEIDSPTVYSFISYPSEKVFTSVNVYDKTLISIKDQIFEENEPVRTKLYLYEKYSGSLLSTCYSTSDGFFEFRGLEESLEYVVTSYDKKYQFNSIIKDYNKERI